MKGNHLPILKKVQILTMLCEGSSMRSISRIMGCSINTVTKLMVEIGKKCEIFQHEKIRDLEIKQIQVDEIWSFCYGKSKNVSKDKGGDVWTWVAVCPKTKLVICSLVGARDLDSACRFMRDLRQRVKGRPQISSDGHNPYIRAVEAAFGSDVHFGMLIKNYANDELNITKQSCLGNPDITAISTSHVERQNLSMRMGMRRYTRRTNGHSKKMENHKLALALYYFYFNYVRIHTGLRVTPAMEAGLTDHVWRWEEMLTV